MTYRVVVGVDGSPHSAAALRWALEQAEVHRGEVMALFSWQMPLIAIPGGYSKEEVEQAAKAMLLASVAEVAPQPRVPLQAVVAESDPTEALIHASAQANLLVVGIRGRSPFAGLMLGSVSQACAAHAACPVVLVKQSDAPEAGADAPQTASARRPRPHRKTASGPDPAI
ncbi:MAG TPA: universal stress protein [Streptosporangiaceae bacterium]|nr:universal stress protein [Streptosporangiaceae bacterium]